MKEVFLMIGKRIVLMLLCLCLLCTSLPLVAAAESPYYIRVDLTNNIVVRQMICSGGMARYKSPRGTYTMPTQRKKFERSDWYTFEDGYGKFGSRIVGSYLFHSYLFHSKNDEDVDWETYAAMGTDASHGCIRLYIEDAKWIADNCLAGTKVTLYDNDTRYDYLKELLYQQTYTIDSGKTYTEFVCMASNDTELGYYSKGETVTDLQNRMIALGLYAGEADGFYDETMVRAIKAIQTVLGRRPTGVADNELVEILMSDDAPTSTISTLEPGMSGPAVKPVAVRMVYQVAQAVKIPIIGMGGIQNAEDALEFILAGATAVSVGTANFHDPCTTVKVVEGIRAYMEQYGVEDIHELIGAVK